MADRLDLRGIGAILLGAVLLVGVGYGAGFVSGYMAGKDGPLVYGAIMNSNVSMGDETPTPTPQSTPPIQHLTWEWGESNGVNNTADANGTRNTETNITCQETWQGDTKTSSTC